MFLVFAKGVAAGFVIAAPVGPIGLLCVRRALAGGLALGIASGLGAALADAVYGLLAALGVQAAGSLLSLDDAWLRLVGGLVLLAMAAYAWRVRHHYRPPGSPPLSHGALVAAFVSAFVLAVTNPVTLLSFTAFFAGFGLASGSDGVLAGACLVAGVYLGAALWWVGIVVAAARLGRRFDERTMAHLNRAFAALFAILGVAAVATSVAPLAG